MAVKKAISKGAKKVAKKPTKGTGVTSSSRQKENDKETIVKKPHRFDGTKGVKFTKENQPTPEAKSEGKRVAKSLREFLMMPLKKGKLTKEFDRFLYECVTNYGIPKEEVTVKLFMEMRIASQAVRGDVQAYKALQDRAFGKPREEQAPIIETANHEDEKTKFILPGGIELEL